MSKVNRASLYEQLEKTSDRVTQAKAALAHAQANGTLREIRRARKRLEQWDEEETRIFGLLHPISEGSPFDIGEQPDECAYKCGWKWNNSEEHKEMRWKYVDVCPRCFGQPVSEYDPNFDPDLDRRHT